MKSGVLVTGVDFERNAYLENETVVREVATAPSTRRASDNLCRLREYFADIRPSQGPGVHWRKFGGKRELVNANGRKLGYPACKFSLQGDVEVVTTIPANDDRDYRVTYAFEMPDRVGSHSLGRSVIFSLLDSMPSRFELDIVAFDQSGKSLRGALIMDESPGPEQFSTISTPSYLLLDAMTDHLVQ